MLKLIETFRSADILVPDKDTETFHMVCWGKNYRYWLRKFENCNPSSQKKYPQLKMTICADNDCYFQQNIELEKTKEAALISNAEVIIPQFKDASMNPTDFNDMFVWEGKDAVKEILEKALG